MPCYATLLYTNKVIQLSMYAKFVKMYLKTFSSKQNENLFIRNKFL